MMPDVPEPSWNSIVKANFDKLLLLGLFVLILILGLVIRLMGKENTEWSLQTADLLLGTLIGLVTGSTMSKR
jgi:hypothetical protein